MTYETYDTSVKRVFGQVNLEFPHQLQDILISQNEIGYYDIFNSVMEKLTKNLEYLDDSCKLYDSPPISYQGWLGTDLTYRYNWHTEYSLSDTLSAKVESVDDPDRDTFENAQDAASDGTYLYVINDNVIEVIEISTGYKISTRPYRTIGEPFYNLKRIGLDSSGKVFVLDTERRTIIVYKYDSVELQWDFLYEWGGYGGAETAKFSNPVDMCIKDDFVWILDENNSNVKQYTNTGSLVKIINITGLHKDEYGVSVALDSSNNLHILSSFRIVYKYDQNGNFLLKYNITSSFEVPKKIIKAQDDGFMYICLIDKIIKIIETDGTIAGFFANNLEGYVVFNSICHDVDRNFFIVNHCAIVHFIDYLVLKRLNQDVMSFMWPISSLMIDKDEFKQDWVYFKNFSRYWDNIELFRRSLIGKPIFVETDIQGVSSLKITSFKSCEYRPFEYSKVDMLIGMNELYTSEVFNRIFTKLYSNLSYLLELVEGTVSC